MSDDKGFVLELIEQIGRAYNVDEDRVYAAGYSNGSFFSYYLACTAGEHFAAIGSVSGTHLDVGDWLQSWSSNGDDQPSRDARWRGSL